MRIRARRSRSGFTLVELVISGALMAVVLASAYLCLSAGVASRNLVEERSEAAQSGRVALQLMAADLRNAVPLSADLEFIGLRRTLEDGVDADNLDFATRNHSPRSSRAADFAEVSYFLRKDPNSSTHLLMRRRDETRDPEPFAGGPSEELARGVSSLRFEYYDGFDWYEEWGDPTGKRALSENPDPNLTGLPEAVKITLTLDPSFQSARDEAIKEPPLVLQTVARIPLAMHFYRTTTPRATNNAASPGGAQ